jgi:hypothetical protein
VTAARVATLRRAFPRGAEVVVVWGARAEEQDFHLEGYAARGTQLHGVVLVVAGYMTQRNVEEPSIYVQIVGDGRHVGTRLYLPVGWVRLKAPFVSMSFED